ncbi:MAG: alkaline phosphatase family protein [Armatimonadetes bacterium]|nr:alkaline phosphatase family protein [Armatimonadota bacterium]MDW8122273.1 alkaline phosphatase family protein [Armatimonadota bacterium]
MNNRVFASLMVCGCLVSVLVVLISQPFGHVMENRAVIVSWDGGKPSAIGRLVARGQLPVVAQLMRQGAYTLTARTIVPSSTLPSHASMLSGLTPEGHKVFWNNYQADKGYIQVPTVFLLAKQAGLMTGMVYSKKKLHHLAVPGSVDEEIFVAEDASSVARHSVRLLKRNPVHLLFVHFSDPDAAGHQDGWGSDKKGEPPSPAFLDALKACDRATGLLVTFLKSAGLWDRTLLIVTADHGGQGKQHGSADDEDVLIPWVASGGLAAKKGKLWLMVKTMDTAPTVLLALGLPIPSDWDGKPIRNALKPPISFIRAY